MFDYYICHHVRLLRNWLAPQSATKTCLVAMDIIYSLFSPFPSLSYRLASSYSLSGGRWGEVGRGNLAGSERALKTVAAKRTPCVKDTSKA